MRSAGRGAIVMGGRAPSSFSPETRGVLVNGAIVDMNGGLL
jgi:hypothetical protein